MDVGANTTDSPMEDYLCDLASAKNVPILGTFELTPCCNLDCEMCYIRMKHEDMEKRGGLRPVSYWLDLAQKAKDNGLLFLLITGGEPLTYPGFKELFTELQKMGFFITMNTNGTLIDEEMARFLHEHSIRRLNITLYGKDDETYARLCHNPKGFTQLSNAMKYLNAYGIPVRLSCSLVKENIDQLEDLDRIAEEWGAPIEYSYLMFRPNRKIYSVEYFDSHRLTAKESAEAAFWINTHRLNKEQTKEACAKKLSEILPNPEKNRVKKGFICRAANNTFWANWRGNLTPCGIMNGPEVSQEELGFAQAWEELKKQVMDITLSEECYKCKYLTFCPHCASSEVAENGAFGTTPKYICEFTKEYEQLLRKAVEE